MVFSDLLVLKCCMSFRLIFQSSHWDGGLKCRIATIVDSSTMLSYKVIVAFIHEDYF